jgi:hypothetical protein
MALTKEGASASLWDLKPCGGILRLVTYAALVMVLIFAAGCSPGKTGNTAVAGQSSQSAVTGRTQSASSSDVNQKDHCPVTHSQVDNVLRVSTKPDIVDPSSGILCGFSMGADEQFAPAVMIQKFPLPDQPDKTLGAAYAGITQPGSTDQVTKEPAWGDGAFLDATQAPGLIGYIGFIPGYEVHLSLASSDRSRVAQAEQIMSELVNDIQH